MMDTILVAGYTVQDALQAVGIVIGVFILFTIAKKVADQKRLPGTPAVSRY